MIVLIMQLSSSSNMSGGVRMPAYDRTKLKPGIVHIGFGAFHRAHQAAFTQDAGGWQIESVSMRNPALSDALNAAGGSSANSIDSVWGSPSVDGSTSVTR